MFNITERRARRRMLSRYHRLHSARGQETIAPVLMAGRTGAGERETTMFLRAITLIGLLTTFVGAASARAEECANINLLAELRRENPQDYAALRAEAAATANGNGVFWKVTGGAAAPSWLFGTIHKADPRVLALPDAVENALERADTLAVELVDAGDRGAVGALIGNDPDLVMMPPGESLSDHIDPATIRRLSGFLEARGMRYDMIANLQPWISTGMLAVSLCDLAAGGPAGTILDTHLVNLARERDMEVVGLETLRGQLTALSEVDRQLYFDAIADIARLHARGLYEPLLQTLTELYLDGDIAAIMPIQMYYSAATPGDIAQVEKFLERIVNVRNAEMADKAAALIARKSTVVAVGALHLSGENGLVAALRERGYTVTRVPVARERE